MPTTLRHGQPCSAPASLRTPVSARCSPQPQAGCHCGGFLSAQCPHGNWGCSKASSPPTCSSSTLRPAQGQGGDDLTRSPPSPVGGGPLLDADAPSPPACVTSGPGPPAPLRPQHLQAWPGLHLCSELLEQLPGCPLWEGERAGPGRLWGEAEPGYTGTKGTGEANVRVWQSLLA